MSYSNKPKHAVKEISVKTFYTKPCKWLIVCDCFVKTLLFEYTNRHLLNNMMNQRMFTREPSDPQQCSKRRIRLKTFRPIVN
jgi:hypothetical protein